MQFASSVSPTFEVGTHTSPPSEGQVSKQHDGKCLNCLSYPLKLTMIEDECGRRGHSRFLSGAFFPSYLTFLHGVLVHCKVM